MVSPVRFAVGDRVRLTSSSYQRAADSSRSVAAAGHPSQDFLQKLGVHVGCLGTVTHAFPPSYEVTVKFGSDSFHMKDSWVEPPIDEFNLFVVVNPHDAEATEWFRGVDARRTNRRTRDFAMTSALSADALYMSLRDQHETAVGTSRVMRAYRLHGEPYNWVDPVTQTRYNKYAIVYPAFIDQSAVSRGGSLHNWFRVVNLWTGAESSLYSLQECERIIMLALSQGLKGSFN